MSENKIELKSIPQLLNLNFFIPSYQRGYRWTTQQVKDLLEDIRDFSQQKHQEGEFYCVQPLVVREMNEQEKKQNSLEGKWYEVIDGQQRLTTIYLILLCLEKDIKEKETTKSYQLKYQRELGRDRSLDLLLHIKEVNLNHIDAYHLTKAYYQ